MTHINRYTCEEAFRRLDDYLDHELSEPLTESVETPDARLPGTT